MMAEHILEWGKKHGCQTKRDSKGNVYLEKGSGIRPTLLNHIDTVHKDQEEMVKKHVFKELVWGGDRVTAVNPLTGKQTGLGMDNQGGACIALAVIDRLDAVKALFTVEEELGMLGIKAADMSFFDDAAFVVSNDSPDENRATHFSAGIPLYSDDFFEKWLEPICKSGGVTSFRSEPWTCVKHVRATWKDKDGKHLECFNFGNAGDHPHTDLEGASFSGVCKAEELLYELCTKIPSDVQHVSELREPKASTSPLASMHSRSLPYLGVPQVGGWNHYVGHGASALTLASIDSHDDGDQCQFTFTYDDEEQHEKHLKLMEREEVAVEMEELDPETGTADAFGELFEMKLAYILWYQLFYDAPEVKTWKQLAAVDDLTDFADNLVFADDAGGYDDEYA